MAFVGPHHRPKILGKNHQSTTKVTLNEPPNMVQIILRVIRLALPLPEHRKHNKNGFSECASFTTVGLGICMRYLETTLPSNSLFKCLSHKIEINEMLNGCGRWYLATAIYCSASTWFFIVMYGESNGSGTKNTLSPSTILLSSIQRTFQSGVRAHAGPDEGQAGTVVASRRHRRPYCRGEIPRWRGQQLNAVLEVTGQL